ncbi:hypothetical protein WJX72_003730 [[Myrmecia] bisecta]|uniref:ATP-dependent DNA helicase n=1 Tax=[Myrmecia] bisecta TaxID=41462 RepID=A0AAW1QQ27_9CHLO
MASVTTNVRLEYRDTSGNLLRAQSGKQVVVELQRVGFRGKTQLSLAFPAKEVCLPVEPPMSLHAARTQDGIMSLCFMRARLHPTGPIMSLQLMLSEADPEQLIKLRDIVDMILMRALGKPLQPLCPNKPQGQNPVASLKRKASNMAAPSMSTFSTESRQSGWSASSKGPPAQDQEELPPLTPEQQAVLDLIKAGKSVFFTGCAGTGKSLLLRHILRALPASSTFTTASTGLAACALGGTTINAFAGIGRAEGSLDVLKAAAAKGDSARRWRQATTLVVDEVSMVDGSLFDKLESIARHVRKSQQAFGGIQLVLAGDFHQLPPVTKGKEGMAARRFCFESPAWWKCVNASLQLHRVFRQADSEFVDILAAIRSGACSKAVLADLQRRCSRELDTSDGILPTKLYTHREDVDLINKQQLEALSSEAVRFACMDAGSTDILKTACPARTVLELKVGAQVMLLRNISARRGLVNGSRGVVQRFAGGTLKLPVVRFANGEVSTVGKERWSVAAGGRLLGSRMQIPLDLAWAMSVHKSQGMTLDRVEVCLERAFEAGMAYVALSRVKSLEGLRLLGGIHPHALTADAKVVKFYKTLQQNEGDSRAWPSR